MKCIAVFKTNKRQQKLLNYQGQEILDNSKAMCYLSFRNETCLMASHTIEMMT